MRWGNLEGGVETWWRGWDSVICLLHLSQGWVFEHNKKTDQVNLIKENLIHTSWFCMLQRILGCAKFMLRVLKISDFRGMSIPAGLWERKENVHLRPVAQTALFFPQRLWLMRAAVFITLPKINRRVVKNIHFKSRRILLVLKNIGDSCCCVPCRLCAWQPTYYGHGHKQPDCGSTRPKKIVLCTKNILLKDLDKNHTFESF